MFAKIENGVVTKYPYTLKDFKADHPNVSFPKDLSSFNPEDFNAYRVTSVAPPAPSNPMTVRVVELNPTLVNGNWTQTWGEEPLSSEEIAQLQKDAEQQQVEDAAKADAFIQQFVQYNAQQVQNYVDTNVTDLASAKAVLKKLALICLALAKTRLS